jgi:D-3-phosphoglycerate dehydrogenase / 2-oxoglutarate reductase
MKPLITILEAIHPKGIDLLSEYANVQVRLGLDRAAIMDTCTKSDVVVIKSVVQVNEDFLDCAPRLKLVARAGTGTDNIDLDICKQRKVKVFTVPTGNTITAAEFTVAMILMLCRRIPEVISAVQKKDFRRHLLEGRELSRLSVGIVGLGNVGSSVAERLLPFGCKLLGYDPNIKDSDFELLESVERVDSIESLISKVDILTLHAKLNLDNFNMIGADQFSYAKDGIYLVNAARAALVDHTALIDALDEGRVAFAAIDVLEPEPPFDLSPDKHEYHHILLEHPRVLITPHIGASTEDAQRKIAVDLAEQIRRYFS